MLKILRYACLLLMSRDINFEAMGRIVKKTGKTVSRWLEKKEKYYDQLNRLLRRKFNKRKKKLYLIFDDTLLKKLYAETIEGTTLCYHTKMYRRINAFRALVAMLSDGQFAVPFWSEFLFAEKMFPDLFVDKIEYVKKIIAHVQEMFPHKIITVLADGAFSRVEFTKWCSDNNIRVEMRIRKNAKVFYNDEEIAINLIESLKPKGFQNARSIHVIWHEIPVWITAHRRVDNQGNETIVYQISTFTAKPAEHVNIYLLRWDIEKFFRTAKQKLGLESCTARKIETQKNHVAAVIFAYVLAQLKCQKEHLKNADTAIRAFDRKKCTNFELHIKRLDHLFHSACV